MSETREHDPEVIGNPETGTLERTKPKKPSMWHVIMLNDDFTPMDFVVAVLQRVFNKSHEEAEAITFQIHVEGKGIAGTYTLEICETKAQDTMALARHQGHPLQLIVERAV